CNPSMPPEIYFDDGAVNVENRYGEGETIPGDALSSEELARLRQLQKYMEDDVGNRDEMMEEANEILGDYVGENLRSFEVASGWIAHLWMPGYLDQTEPTLYPTLKEAVEELHNMYADCEEAKEDDEEEEAEGA